MAKRRLSVSVDEEVLAAGQRAVEAGRAANLSAWVNEALRQRAEHDAKLAALDEFLAAYQEEFGEITDAEAEAGVQRMLDRAIKVRDGETIYPASYKHSPS